MYMYGVVNLSKMKFGIIYAVHGPPNIADLLIRFSNKWFGGWNWFRLLFKQKEKLPLDFLRKLVPSLRAKLYSF